MRINKMVMGSDVKLYDVDISLDELREFIQAEVEITRLESKHVPEGWDATENALQYVWVLQEAHGIVWEIVGIYRSRNELLSAWAERVEAAGHYSTREWRAGRAEFNHPVDFWSNPGGWA